VVLFVPVRPFTVVFVRAFTAVFVWPVVVVPVRPFTVVLVWPFNVVLVWPTVLVPVRLGVAVVVWPVELGVVRLWVFVWLGVVVCCVGADGWLGAEVWAGALAWGAGALGRGADGAFLCWAMANAAISVTSANKTYLRTPLSFLMRFIANS
jgi:hypothetical protein